MSSAIHTVDRTTNARGATLLAPEDHTATMPALPGVQDEAPARQSANGSCGGEACVQAQAEAAEPLLLQAQQRWAARPLTERIQVLRAARHRIAAKPEIFAQVISPQLARSQADTLVSEVLPLLDAMRFLERSARQILAPRRLGSSGRPVWLTGVDARIYREPLGHILILAPANFPLFLPGVQVMQALTAGNAVTWKPGSGGRRVAVLLNHILREAGLPRGVLHVTEETAEAGEAALQRRPDKVILTGSFPTGQRVLSALAETVTPATMELSGADAVVVLPSADLALAAEAIAFGLRLNGAEVCMSPRRLIATDETLRALRPLLGTALQNVPAVSLMPATADRLRRLLQDAIERGARLVGGLQPGAQLPLLVEDATPAMDITQADIFAPVLSLLRVSSVLHAADTVNQSPMGLTAAIFGEPREAATLAKQLRVGTVLINDLIAPTADPRIPFGGRGRSGFGVTRGAEGLLEMTATKTVLCRRKGLKRHYAPLRREDLPLFTNLIGFLHGGSLSQRWKALRGTLTAARSRSAS